MPTSRIRLSTGTLPSPLTDRLVTSHPFVQQIDIVFPSRTAPDDPFTSLKTTYSTTQFTLSELYAYASRLPIPNVPFKAHPVQRDADDTWCIDPRGTLTLCVSKSLYERLGVVGKRLPFKGCPEQYVIGVPLTRGTTSSAMAVRHKAALGVWDRVREETGRGRWCVAYVSADESSGPVDSPEAHVVKDVSARVRHDADVYVPHVGDLTRTASTSDAPAHETKEEHDERLEALFEWVGMACLGAQRLCANDRVDPYVAVYEAPSPASVGDVTRVQWKGLMGSAFVRSVIDTAVSTLSASNTDKPFIAVTLRSNLVTPVSYLPESTGKEAPLRVPGLEAEDTVCFILSKLTNKTTWAIGENIGKWDARWG
ncbi:ribonuclease P 40kDa subunit-domain-containing protein [Chiua virens]|nr:ribonuclease P 40kDa subunit-domain-containing protein [Chiua virens]